MRVGESTLADHLRDIGVRSVLVWQNTYGARSGRDAAVGIDPESEVGQRVRNADLRRLIAMMVYIPPDRMIPSALQ